ncbi:hypothetical protein [Actinomarinicola tropica]|uniref:Uncharacterized protein n=1 Tax=Actinomarinicola tropica TaxID=2789776 RepID=A0A5Q2RIY1_9ACTN|nr:hypothetical protein [Actinomarinicola tropica]QGG94346.1 hypothetical protein GH723_04085 [Actinomarinicola tropica]
MGEAGRIERIGHRGARRIAALAVVVALTVAACGDDAEPTAADQVPAVAPDDDGLVPFCEDVPPPGPVAQGELARTANPDVILMGVLQTYGQEHAESFGGLWIDRSAGSIVLAFTDDPAPHRAAIAELRPSPDDVAVVEPRPEITETTTVAESGTTVDLVQVAHTEAELLAVSEEVVGSMDELGIIGVGVKTDLNRVSIDLRLADAEIRAAVGELGPIDALCVNGPTEPPVPIDPATVDLLAVGDDELVSCDGYTFPHSALDEPGDLLDSDDPLAEAVRADLPNIGSEPDDLFAMEWRVLSRGDSEALVGGGTPPSVLLRLVEDRGRWRSEMGAVGAPCTLRRAVPEGVEAVTWALDPAYPEPGADATELHVLVSSSACSSGEPLGDRLIGPQVEVTDDEVAVAFAAAPLPAGAYTCQGSPPDAVVVTLDEPVGDRTIVDALDLPPRPPVAAADPLFG